MCRPESEKAIVGVINNWTNEEYMFTAYQVFQAMNDNLKKDGLKTERYSDVKSVIHRHLMPFVNTGDYNRTLSDVGGKVPAFVYYPEGEDVFNFDPSLPVGASIAVTGSFTQLAASINDATRNAASASSPNTAKNLTCDARGTLCVPLKTTLEAGLAPNDRVYAWFDEVNGKRGVGISKAPAPLTAIASSSYTVDRYGNVRITKYLVGGLSENLNNKSEATFQMEVVDYSNDKAIVVFCENDNA